MYTAFEYKNITYIVKSDEDTPLNDIKAIQKKISDNISASKIVRNCSTFEKIEQSQNKERVNLIGLISQYNIPKHEIIII
nr:hypothetical protein [Nanoarchaeota archaeon]